MKDIILMSISILVFFLSFLLLAGDIGRGVHAHMRPPATDPRTQAASDEIAEPNMKMRVLAFALATGFVVYRMWCMFTW